MSAPVVLVFAPSGEAFLRADTAAKLGIKPQARLSQRDYDAALWEDYCRNQDDKRRRAS